MIGPSRAAGASDDAAHVATFWRASPRHPAPCTATNACVQRAAALQSSGAAHHTALFDPVACRGAPANQPFVPAKRRKRPDGSASVSISLYNDAAASVDWSSCRAGRFAAPPRRRRVGRILLGVPRLGGAPGVRSPAAPAGSLGHQDLYQPGRQPLRPAGEPGGPHGSE